MKSMKIKKPKDGSSISKFNDTSKSAKERLQAFLYHCKGVFKIVCNQITRGLVLLIFTTFSAWKNKIDFSVNFSTIDFSSMNMLNSYSNFEVPQSHWEIQGSSSVKGSPQKFRGVGPTSKLCLYTVIIYILKYFTVSVIINLLILFLHEYLLIHNSERITLSSIITFISLGLR